MSDLLGPMNNKGAFLTHSIKGLWREVKAHCVPHHLGIMEECLN